MFITSRSKAGAVHDQVMTVRGSWPEDAVDLVSGLGGVCK